MNVFMKQVVAEIPWESWDKTLEDPRKRVHEAVLQNSGLPKETIRSLIEVEICFEEKSVWAAYKVLFDSEKEKEEGCYLMRRLG